MHRFRLRPLAALLMLLSGTFPMTASPVAKDGEEPPAATDVRVEMSGSSGGNKGARTESREVVITAAKPGFVHLWHDDGDTPLGAALLPSPDGASYFRKVAYEARESGGQSGAAVFTYRIIAGPGEKEMSKTIELWNHRHISYDAFATGLRGIQDPSGICLREVPMDLTPVGDEALLMEITETPTVSRVSPWVMHIWHPTYHVTPPRLPSGLATAGVQIGYMIKTAGDPKNRANPPDGQKIGRISQRDGKWVAKLSFRYGTSTTGYGGTVTPECPVDFDVVGGFSGAVWTVAGVITENRDVMPFLLGQLRRDLKGSRWEEALNESGKGGGANPAAESHPSND